MSIAGITNISFNEALSEKDVYHLKPETHNAFSKIELKRHQ